MIDDLDESLLRNRFYNGLDQSVEIPVSFLDKISTMKKPKNMYVKCVPMSEEFKNTIIKYIEGDKS